MQVISYFKVIEKMEENKLADEGQAEIGFAAYYNVVFFTHMICLVGVIWLFYIWFSSESPLFLSPAFSFVYLHISYYIYIYIYIYILASIYCWVQLYFIFNRVFGCCFCVFSRPFSTDLLELLYLFHFILFLSSTNEFVFSKTFSLYIYFQI